MRPTLRQHRDRASLYLLFGLFVLLPLTAVFGHRGVAPWLLLASIPAFVRGDFWQSAFGALFDRMDLRNPFFAGFAAVMFFCFWIFLSGFWSPRDMPSLALWVLAPALVGGSVVWFSLNLAPSWSYRLSIAFAMSIAAGMAVLLAEGLSDGFLRSVLPPEAPDRVKDITALGWGVTALAPALIPAAVIVSMLAGRTAAFGLLALGAGAAVSNDITANVTAILAGLGAAAFAYKAPGRGFAVTGWAIIVCLLLSPFAAFIPVEAAYEAIGERAPTSWLHRLSVWHMTAARIPEGLPFGFGADFTRIWHETAPLITVPGARVPLSAIAVHPHNIFLQTWLELGLPGVIAFAVFVHCGARLLREAALSPAVAAAIVGSVVVFLVTVMVDGSLWQVWRFASMALAAMGAALGYSLEQALKR